MDETLKHPDYDRHYAEWRRTLPDASHEFIHDKVIKHLAFKEQIQAMASKPQVTIPCQFIPCQFVPTKCEFQAPPPPRNPWELRAIIVLLALILISMIAKIAHGEPAPALPLPFSHVMMLPQAGSVPIPLPIQGSGSSSPVYVICSSGCSAAGSFADNSTFTVGTTPGSILFGYYTSGAAPTLTSGSAARARLDANSYLAVDCITGCSASAGFADNSAFTAGTTAIGITGGWYATSPTACTTGNACAPSMTIDRKMFVSSFEGGSWTVTANAGTNLNTSALALESGGNLATIAGAVSSSLFQDNISKFGGSSVTLGQQTAANSMPVILPSATITTLTPPTAAAVGTSVSADLLIGTQAANLSVPVALPSATITTLTPPSAAAIGTAVAAPSASAIGTAVSADLLIGTQTAAASVPVALPTATITTLTPPTASAIGTAVAAPTAAAIASAIVSNPPPLIAGTATIGSVKLTDGTNTEVVTPASTSPASTSAAATVSESPNSKGCAGQSLANTSSVAISTSSGSEVQLVAGSSGKSIYVCHFDFVATTAVTVTLQQASSGTCSTLTAMTGAYPAGSNGGLSSGNGQGVLFTVASGDQLCLLLGSGVATAGLVTYAQVAAP